jgi:excisionase family DNA binding protein
MSSTGDFLTTEEAATMLGVTVQQVRRLADSGELVRLARGLIDRASLDRYLAERHGGRTRVWAEHTAWGAIAMLSGTFADWLGPAQGSRIRTALREIDDPSELVVRCRDRAVVTRYSGHSSALGRLRQHVVNVDRSALGLVATSADQVDGYIAAETVTSTAGWLGLVEDARGIITLRATTFDIKIVEDMATQSTVLAALDAATSLDPRERGVGERVLLDALNRYRQ